MEKTLIIRDAVLKSGFTQMPNCVLLDKDLGLAERLLYAILLRYAWQNDECFPGQPTLAGAMRCGDRNVRKLLLSLKKARLLDWKRRGLNMTNIYYLLPLRLRYPEIEADRIYSSAPERSSSSAPKRTSSADKEYSVEQYSVEKDSEVKALRLSANPKIADMQKFLGFPEKNVAAGWDSHGKQPVPNPAMEAKFIQKIEARGYDWLGDIFPCWQKKVQARREFVSMRWVNEDIGKDGGNGANREHLEEDPAERLRASVGRPL